MKTKTIVIVVIVAVLIVAGYFYAKNKGFFGLVADTTKTVA